MSINLMKWIKIPNQKCREKPRIHTHVVDKKIALCFKIEQRKEKKNNNTKEEIVRMDGQKGKMKPCVHIFSHYILCAFCVPL